MTRSTRFLLAVTALIVPHPCGVRAEASDESDFLAEYAKHEPDLYEQYIKNRRIKVVVKAYSKLEPTGAFEGQAEDTIVTRGDAFRANSVMKRLDKSQPYKAGAMWFEDEAYCVSESSGSGYKLDEHYPESNRKHKINETAARYKGVPRFLGGQATSCQ